MKNQNKLRKQKDIIFKNKKNSCRKKTLFNKVKLRKVKFITLKILMLDKAFYR
jgi:hypothetical protein